MIRIFFILAGTFLVAVSSLPAAELFQDLSLEQGFDLSAVTSQSTPLSLGPVLSVSGAEEPAWRLAQWGTQFSLLGAKARVLDDGTRIMENEAKRVVIHSGGLAGEGVTLTVLAGAEYGGALRKQGEAWPHLLVEQQFSPGIALGSLKEARFALDFRVDRCDLVSKDGVDKNLHTGQINAFFSIRNRNESSADFNDMIWFGLPIFDARFELPPGHQAVDKGKDDATGKFICTLPGTRFYTGPTGDGAWHQLRGDLVPLVKEALAASQEKGFLTDTHVDDLEPTSFNLGWEVPGPYDCEITLKGLSLVGVEKP